MSELEPVLECFKETEDRIITIKVEAIEEDFRWLFGDIIDGTTCPVNWRNLHSLLLEDMPYQISGNYSSTLRSMKQLKLGGNGDNELPCYKMDARPRGIALIINNIKFQTRSTRDNTRAGTLIDEKKLEALWRSLHFNIKTEKNLSKNEMEQKLKSIADMSHERHNCLVVCLLSHGDLGKVYGIDFESLDITEIQSYFYANKCPSLAGKPKLFFIQACRGCNTQTGLHVETDGGIKKDWETDGPGGRKISVPDKSDFLTGFSTTPGDTSVRRPNHGSLYISILCHVMKKYVKKRKDLSTILTVVNQQVSDIDVRDESGDPVLKQVPQLCHTLSKRVLF